ncbi:MAG: alpha/beta fold hydrolase [Thermomicrobiales bacterium]|nr:alpha/beta fold hydrolase [Thermomicrobiales bacterium]
MRCQARVLPSRLNRRSLVCSAAALVTTRSFGSPWRAVAQETTPAASATPLAEGHIVPVHGADLYYEFHGAEAGPPVLLLHGGLGNTKEFRHLTPPLVAAGYRTLAFDQRGRGRSTWGDSPMTYEQMAADTVALLDYLGIERTDVVGWSDGGIVALELAVTHPERLSRVVAYGANSRPDGNYAEPQVSDQMPPFEDFIADYQRLSPEPERFEELTTMLGTLYQVAPDFTDGELGSIAVPVLILAGTDEEFVRPEDTQRLATLIPGAELALIPDTGHFAPFARPDAFNQIVLAFLAGEMAATPTV